MTLHAGSRALDVTDSTQGARVPAWLLYPTTTASSEQRFGPYALDLAPDAPPVAGDDLPLVVVSHGTGSSPWVLRGLATHLARAGFAVVLLEHPGNSRNDDSLAHTAVNLANRPRHVRLVIDAALADPVVGPRLSRAGVAVIGHSLGGYTALAVAGGHPAAFGNQTPDGLPHPVPVTPDERVRAVVLLAPATVWYTADGSLADVRVPIQMWTGEHDEHAPSFHGDIVLGGVADRSRVEHQVVAGAGHFSFLTPFPPALVRPGFAPAHDPPGFDRAAFLPTLHGGIERFVRRSLTG